MRQHITDARSRRQLQQARLTASLAGAENKLTIDMEGQWGYAVRKPQNVFNNDYSRWNLTFNFKLPLFDSGRKSGLVMQAASRLHAAEQRLAQLENDVRLEVKQAYDDMQSSAKAIAAALPSNLRVIPASEQGETVTQLTAAFQAFRAAGVHGRPFIISANRARWTLTTLWSAMSMPCTVSSSRGVRNSTPQPGGITLAFSPVRLFPEGGFCQATRPSAWIGTGSIGSRSIATAATSSTPR